MLRFAAIGAVFLIGCGLAPLPAAADVPAPGEKVRPGCPCPPVVHRRHVRVRHHRFVPPPAVAVVERDFYNVLIPSTYDPAYDRVVVDHFRTPTVTGFTEPWRPKPVWPGILPYRATAPDGIVQYDGLTGEYIRLAAVDAAKVAAPMPLPPPPPKPSWQWW